MSEDGPGDGAGEHGTASNAEPEARPEERRPRSGSRRARIALLGVGAAVVLVAVLLAVRSRPERVASGPEVIHRDAGAALRAPEGPSLPAHPGRGAQLTGFVIDGAGIPVAGAEVTAELERGVSDHGASGSAREAPAIDGGSVAPAAVAVGDAGVTTAVAPLTTLDGRFVVDGLVPGRYRLRVTGAGLLAAEVRYVPAPSDEARIVVARQVAIEGTVFDGGKPAHNVEVGLRGDAIGGTIETKSDAHGGFSFPKLPEGRYQLFAWQGALAARAIRVARLGAGPFPPIELRLEAATIVVGRVIDRDEGTGLVAAIELRPSGDDQVPRYARSGDDGVFRIEGVPTGRWIADAFAPGYASPGGIELEAGRGVPELGLLRGGAIEGRVIDGDGRPIAGARVRALAPGANALEISADVDQDKLRRFTGRTGSPSLSATPVVGAIGSDPALLARGELGVLVGPIPPIPPPGAQVARAAAIDPQISGLAGDPAPLVSDPARAPIWVTGTDGRYRIVGLSRGKLTVLAIAPGFAEARGKQVTVELAQTQTGIDIVLTPGTVLVGKVTDQHGTPIVGAQVAAKPQIGAAIEAFTDEAGEYRIGPVTGAIELRAIAYGHGEAKREIELVPAKGQVAAEHREDLVLALADAVLAGILDDAAGAPVAGARLEVIGGAGDGRRAVVAADGTFSIDMLPAGRLRLRVEHPAYPTEELDAEATPGGATHVRLRLPLGGAVEGVLLDGTSGAPLASITLEGTGPGGGTADTSTDKSGRWKLGPLKPGRWKLAIKLPGFLPLVREIDVPASHAPGTTSVYDVRLELARGGLIGGTVRDSRGKRIVGAVISARVGDGPSVEGTTDVQGEFHLRDCPTGELEITASKGELRGSTHATLRPGTEVLGLSIDIK